MCTSLVCIYNPPFHHFPSSPPRHRLSTAGNGGIPGTLNRAPPMHTQAWGRPHCLLNKAAEDAECQSSPAWISAGSGGALALLTQTERIHQHGFASPLALSRDRRLGAWKRSLRSEGGWMPAMRRVLDWQREGSGPWGPAIGGVRSLGGGGMWDRSCMYWGVWDGVNYETSNWGVLCQWWDCLWSPKWRVKWHTGGECWVGDLGDSGNQWLVRGLWTEWWEPSCGGQWCDGGHRGVVWGVWLLNPRIQRFGWKSNGISPNLLEKVLYTLKFPQVIGNLNS